MHLHALNARLRGAVVLCLMVAATSASGQATMGYVVDVTAGDRLTLRAPDRTVDVQLANIRAPAPGQALWRESWQSLRRLCYGKAATLVKTGTALNGDTIGEVSCGGVRADEAQVRRGLAKVEQPFLELDSILRVAQNEARSAAVGLWEKNRAPRKTAR